MAPLARVRHTQLRKWARDWPNFANPFPRSDIRGAQDPDA